MDEISLKVFRINADYIKNRPKPNYYYVVAETKAQAKNRFESIVPWLKVVAIAECTKEEADHVLGHPMNYIIWWPKRRNI